MSDTTVNRTQGCTYVEPNGDTLTWCSFHASLRDRAENAEAEIKRLRQLSNATADVIAERHRQQDDEGWTPEHDDAHNKGELSKAAGCYAWVAAQSDGLRAVFDSPPPTWPAGWSAEWWKPTNPRRDLVKAGALILAEIERLDRAANALKAIEPS